jgi:tyrosine-protein kinase Etk/Wzc
VLNQTERPRSANLTPPEEEASIIELFLLIAKRKWLIGKATLGAALVAMIISLLLPVRYKASTSLLPPQQGNSAGAALMTQIGNLGSVGALAGSSLGLKNPSDLQIALLKSRTVEDAVVDRFNLMTLYHKKRKSDARKYLENVVDIESGTKDGIIHLSVTDGDAQRATDIANGYVDEYKRFSATLAVTEASQRRLFFEQQLSEAKDNLAKAEEALKATSQKTGLIQVDAQARAAIELIAGLRAQVAAKEAQIAAMRSYATADNPGLQIAEQELAGLRAQEAKMGAASEGSTNALIPKGNMQEASIEYIRRFRDVKYYETIFDLLARQYEIAKVDEARQGAVVQIVDRAILPDRKSFPMRSLITLGGAALGFIVSIFWVLTREELARILRITPERSRLKSLNRLVSSEVEQEVQY